MFPNSARMRLLLLLLRLSLPLAINATQICAIIGSDGPVHCRSCPHVTCDIVTTIPVGTKKNFTSYAIGDCDGGNCTWDFNADDDCYVSGFYTNANCNTSDLPLSSAPSTSPPTKTSAASHTTQTSSSTISQTIAPVSWAHVITSTGAALASATSGSSSVNHKERMGSFWTVVITSFLSLFYMA